MANRQVEYLLERARIVAGEGKGVGGRHGTSYRMGAVLAFKGRIRAIGLNSYKTHAFLAGYFKYPCIHAEAHAILRQGIDHCGGLEMFVARITKDGHTAMAKPCPSCMNLMGEVGIDRVYYTISPYNYEGVTL